MSFTAIVAVGAALLLLAVLWLRGGYEIRRAASILAIILLAAVTTMLILAGSPVGQEAGTPIPSLTGSNGSPAPSGAASPATSAGAADPTGSPTVLRHEVGLRPGGYTLFTVDAQGTVTAERAIGFDRPSKATVDRVQTPNGLIHWRTVVGGYTGWSYIAGRSGPFIIREVLRWPDGDIRSREIDAES